METKKRVSFITLGCKTNQYETNAMEQKFQNFGYEVVNYNENAENNIDIHIVNTCSVTNMAQRKSRQMLRRIKQKNPNAIVVACGCYAQVAKNEIQEIPEVDLILGTNEKNNIVEIVEEYIKSNTIDDKKTDVSNEEKAIVDTINVKKSIVTDVMHEDQFQDFGTVTYTEQTRAVIKVQDGCDRFCSYCIIPFARGKVRSREPQNIIKEIEEISKQGIKEVILTGIHIASYGKDFKSEKVDEYRKQYNYDEKYTTFDEKDDLMTGGFRLIELLEQINKIKEIERIRLGSIEPKLITKEFLERLSKLDKICHHFHLSLQSGCDETLKRMNRRYTTDEFRNIVRLLRKAYSDVILTTDIIVGFPRRRRKRICSNIWFFKGNKIL